MSAAKIITCFIWLFTLACFFVSSDAWWVTFGQGLAVVLAVAHFIEFFVYLNTLKTLGGSMPVHFIQVMLFGILYWNEIKPVTPAE